MKANCIKTPGREYSIFDLEDSYYPQVMGRDMPINTITGKWIMQDMPVATQNIPEPARIAMACLNQQVQAKAIYILST